VRWCGNCRRFNTGWPVRCRYCAAGLAGRLCPRSHINPVDPGLSFCGECGQPLSQAFGGAFSMRPYVISAGIFLVCIGASLLVLSQAGRLGFGPVVLVLAAAAFYIRFAHRILPPSGQRLVMLFWTTVWFVIRFVFRSTRRIAAMTGNKGRGSRGRGKRRV